MTKKQKIFLIGFLLLFPAAALAHNPRIVKAPVVIQIKNPEISQAFYGQLLGEPQWFEINADNKFLLYVNILVPDTAEAKKDISVEIYRQDWLIGWLDSDNTNWKKFHEPFGGDDYLKGAEYKENATPDLYRIKVYSKTNTGKYALAVGQTESFPLREIINALWLMPQLKRDFFDKSPFSAYFNYVGLFLLGVIVIVAVLVFAGVKIIRFLKNRRRENSI